MTMKSKLTALLSTLILAKLSFGQIKPADLKPDTTITGFHFAVDFQGTKVFTKNGPADIQTINPTAFSLTIAPNMTAEVGKKQLEMLLNLSRQNGYKIADLTQIDTLLNGNKAYYISYVETDDKEKYKNLVFNAFVIKGGTLILFTAGDLDNGMYIEKFKKTFYALEL